jgi:hypothetical protein
MKAGCIVAVAERHVRRGFRHHVWNNGARGCGVSLQLNQLMVCVASVVAEQCGLGGQLVEDGCGVSDGSATREKCYVVAVKWKLDGLPNVGDSSRESMNAQNAASDQRAPCGGLQFKQCYEGHHVHGIWPRGTMVGSGEGAGHEHTMTGVVRCCRNTGGLVGTHEMRWKRRWGAIN